MNKVRCFHLKTQVWSIIIIGIGDADFKSMEILDGDKGLLNSKF